jgi:crotonobetainyl-CoA:carnitine CoA-transferase CaiB-like acyl-CoA transferase
MLGYPVASVKEIFEDPQLQARGFWQKVGHSELGVSMDYPGGFAKFTEGVCQIWRRAPLVGEHNEDVYCGELGLSKTEFDKLKKDGVV